MSFHNHILSSFHQLRQWATDVEALIDVRNPLEHRREENNCNYISATAVNKLVPSFLVKIIWYNCKEYCINYCSCYPNGQNYTDMCGWGEFRQNTDPSLPRQYLKRISDLKRTLLIFNSHTDIFLKINVLENFTDL